MTSSTFGFDLMHAGVAPNNSGNPNGRLTLGTKNYPQEGPQVVK